ncbi:EAL domain-containing protein [Komagataeibacter melaceti]|uniref:EAL domain-containing protein n=2 Tax=Komagataeibacter melaceti TaxID=2766577 RepID=A0A371Z464_9PROT|nr:EAL domain-containing protein [Komagataeibacter melaceti]
MKQYEDATTPPGMDGKTDTRLADRATGMTADVSLELLEQATDGIVIINERNEVIFFNPAAEKLWGFAESEVLGQNVSRLVPSVYRPDHDSYIDRNRESGMDRIVGTSREVTFENKAGDYISGEMSISTAVLGPEKKRYYMAIMKGVTEESHRRKLHDLQNTVFEAISNDMMIPDVADLICREVESFVPNTVAVLILLGDNNRLHILSGPGLPRHYATALENVELSEEDLATIARDPQAVGRIVWDSYSSLGISLGLHNCWASAIKSRNGRISGIFALYSRNQYKLSDWPQKIVTGSVSFCGVVIENYEAQQHISQLANYDSLTGLLNRSAIHKVIRSMIDLPGDNNFAIFMVDIDRFRDINDTLGHMNGDAFLKAIAHRLKTLSRTNYIISRSGGDEFVIVLPDTNEARAVIFADRLIKGMQEPVEIAGNLLVVSLGIGISIFPENGPDGQSLLSHAESAMRRCKKEGRGGYCVSSTADNRAAEDRLLLGSALRDSLARGLLNLHYQPQIDIRTGKLYGAEALSRWNHPTLGNIYPSRFIAVAEDTGQIETIGAWSLEEAVSQVVRWDKEGLHVPAVSVNLSAVHFCNRDLPLLIERILKEHGVAPRRLTVEITESVMMGENEETMRGLSAIRALGVGLSMDDFGTGYSSLSRLTRLPLTEIKIDRTFIMNLEQDANAQAVTTAVIGIGNRLNMTVVTEGVETEAQLKLLQGLNCDVAQGYLFARPMTPDDVLAWSREPHPWRPDPLPAPQP